jgi:Mg2+ and Co2+ transporter CorA
MNFENMPLLKTPNGTWFATAGMLVIAISMLAFFKLRKWP